MAEKKVISVKNMDLAALSTARTERVRVLDAKFEVQNGKLMGADLEIGINVFKTSESSREYHRRISRRKVRYSAVTGGVECTMPHAMSFPMVGRSLMEFEAIKEFCEHIRDILGIDKNYVDEYDQEPPDELALMRKELSEAKEALFPLQNRIKELEGQIGKAADSLRNAAQNLG